jgi:hypothetical protein
MPGGGEPLAQQQRQVIAYQPAQLGRSAEMAVRRRCLTLDAGQQAGQAGLAAGRRETQAQGLAYHIGHRGASSRTGGHGPGCWRAPVRSYSLRRFG